MEVFGNTERENWRELEKVEYEEEEISCKGILQVKLKE